MSKMINRGDMVKVEFIGPWTSRAMHPDEIETMNGHMVPVHKRTYIKVTSLVPEFEVGDIIRHRGTNAVRVLEPTGFRILKSDHMERGEFVEYQPGWNLYNFTSEKWEKVANIG